LHQAVVTGQRRQATLLPLFIQAAEDVALGIFGEGVRVIRARVTPLRNWENDSSHREWSLAEASAGDQDKCRDGYCP
jgi:hypothetical protein